MDWYASTIAPRSNHGTENGNAYRNDVNNAKRSKRGHSAHPAVCPEPRLFLYPTLHNGQVHQNVISSNNRSISNNRSNNNGNSSPRRWQPVDCDVRRTLVNPMLVAPTPRTPPPTRPSPRSWSHQIVSPPNPHRVTSTKARFPRQQHHCLPQHHQHHHHHHHHPYYQRIGPERLQIYKLVLPKEMCRTFDTMIALTEDYVHSSLGSWHTALYSLTKQDVALRDIPDLQWMLRPICEYISEAIRTLYPTTNRTQVVVDRNQPHMLKYSVESGHTGVELHHDCCDVTANLALSNLDSYEGGGTYFPDLRRVVKLERGECLLHPGSLVHGGMEVTKGNRYLMVTFAHLK